MNLDEIKDLKDNINKSFKRIVGDENDSVVELKTMEVEAQKILKSLKIQFSGRNINETSLGIVNILYISLVIQQIMQISVPTFISKNRFEEYKENEGYEIIENNYIFTERNNLILKQNISTENMLKLEAFFDNLVKDNKPITILAIEEPEAHIHPAYQRLVYKDIYENDNISTIYTTHSTHITSITPIKSIIHLIKREDNSTEAYSTTNLELDDKTCNDLERYINVKRGELYFGKAVVLVEGIAEEYFIPKFSKILGNDLDKKGIIICNIDSTNFNPYVKLLEKLDIPYIVITDGDIRKEVNGQERTNSLLKDAFDIETEDLEEESLKALYEKYNIFIGEDTFEIDFLCKSQSNENLKNEIIEQYKNLSGMTDIAKSNFKQKLDNKEYVEALKLIENNIGKGRFSQRISQSNFIEDNDIPVYIKEAINRIYGMVKKIYE